eukprot:6506004-Pyramimonas_sp.AAC.2
MRALARETPPPASVFCNAIIHSMMLLLVPHHPVPASPPLHVPSPPPLARPLHAPPPLSQSSSLFGPLVLSLEELSWPRSNADRCEAAPAARAAGSALAFIQQQQTLTI